MPNPQPDPMIRRRGAGYHVSFWAVAWAFLAVSALSALPSPLYGLYRQRDGFSPFTLTLIYATLGLIFALSPAESQAENVAGFFLASYIGVSVPVIGVGIALQHVSARSALLDFALAVAACIVAAAVVIQPEMRPSPVIVGAPAY